jgi:hypothetical protein
MHRRGLLALLMVGIGGCAPTAQQQAAALTRSESATSARIRQSRRFDTPDQPLMLGAVVGVLQDLGFMIGETQVEHGVVVGSKLAGARIHAQVTLRATADHSATIVRAMFQRVVPRPGAMLASGEVLNDPGLYQGFFEKLGQSVFLTAHEI